MKRLGRTLLPPSPPHPLLVGGRHPELNAYVGGLLASLRPGLAAGSVRKLALVVLSPSGQPVERFVAALQLPGPGEAPPPGEAIAGAGERELERGLKDCLLKLQFQDAGLRPLPPGCTFELVAYSADPDVAPQQWVEEAPQPGECRPDPYAPCAPPPLPFPATPPLPEPAARRMQRGASRMRDTQPLNMAQSA